MPTNASRRTASACANSRSKKGKEKGEKKKDEIVEVLQLLQTLIPRCIKVRFTLCFLGTRNSKFMYPPKETLQKMHLFQDFECSKFN